MKKIYILTIIIITVFITNSFSQVLSADKVSKFTNQKAFENGKSTDVWLLTPTLPVTFSRLVKQDGEWSVGANITIGGSYVFMLGKGTGLSDGSISINPAFFIGITGNIGVVQDFKKNGIESSFMLGGVVGFSKVSALIGYDLLLDTPIIGIGTQIDLLTITDKLTIIRSIR